MRKYFVLSIILLDLSFFFSYCIENNFIRKTYGKNFYLPENKNDLFILGKTPPENIIQIFGNPNLESETIKNDLPILEFTYYFFDASIDNTINNSYPFKILIFYFLNKSLVGYEFSSSFEYDNTFFPNNNLSSIIKNLSTRSDIIKIYGNFYGEMIYPMISNKNQTAIVYSNLKFNSSFISLDINSINIIFFFNKNGTLVDYDFESKYSNLQNSYKKNYSHY